MAAALLGYFIVPAHASGWRIVLVITALPVVMLLWWRRALPESPRWLESRGRTAEAEAVLDRIEADFRRRGATLAEPRRARAPPRGSLGSNFALLLQGRQTRITLMTWIMWLSITFSYYSFFVWIRACWSRAA